MTNYGTYTYNTTIEVQFPNNLVEWEVSIEMNCIHPGDPGKSAPSGQTAILSQTIAWGATPI